MAEERLQRRLAAILSADVVGYSGLMAGDEAGTLARLKALRGEIIDPAIARHAGRIVKLMGDGALVEFASAVDAVTCAIAIQAAVVERDAGSRGAIQFRVGINVGDVIVDGDDIYGDGVNIAARIEALAEPGGICISRAAADQVRDKVPFRIESRGEHIVKGMARPIEVFRVVAGERDAPVPDAAAAHQPAPAAAAKQSIAVLAFTNMSGDADQEYFSDGISEDIITDLSKLSELHVIARNSSFVYKSGAVSIPEVAKALGVRHVLEGSVRRAGDRVRVTAQLIDATTGGHVWADRYDRSLTDIFAVQDELTREIVAALKLKLTVEEKGRLEHKRAVDIEAYNLFLRGREHAWQHTRTANISARALLERAIAIDPGYAAAHAIIAFTHMNDHVNGWGGDLDRLLHTSLEIAQRAVGMDGEDSLAHFAMSLAYSWSRDLDRAIEEARRCIALNPNSAEGHLALAHAQIFIGQPVEAIDTIETYFRLDPHYPDLALHFLAEAHFSLGEFERAIAVTRRRLERNPGSVMSNALLAACCGHLGRFDEARAAWAEALRIDPGYSIERRRRILPFRDPAEFERRVEGLRKAGIPV